MAFSTYNALPFCRPGRGLPPFSAPPGLSRLLSSRNAHLSCKPGCGLLICDLPCTCPLRPLARLGNVHASTAHFRATLNRSPGPQACAFLVSSGSSRPSRTLQGCLRTSRLRTCMSMAQYMFVVRQHATFTKSTSEHRCTIQHTPSHPMKILRKNETCMP